MRYMAKAGAHTCLVVVCEDVELFLVVLSLLSLLKSSAQFAYGNYLVLFFLMFNVSPS
jgi:hypothetical protein